MYLLNYRHNKIFTTLLILFICICTLSLWEFLVIGQWCNFTFGPDNVHLSYIPSYFFTWKIVVLCYVFPNFLIYITMEGYMLLQLFVRVNVLGLDSALWNRCECCSLKSYECTIIKFLYGSNHYDCCCWSFNWEWMGSLEPKDL